MRLFCDEMLARLGRWLRAAGYDTAIAEGGLGDAEIIARCIAEDRTLLTRDRHLAAIAQCRVSVVRLADTTLTAQAHALRAGLDIAGLEIDWQHAPFSRCLVDNTPLDRAPPDRCHRTRAPPAVHCAFARNAAASTGPVAMFAACSPASPNGKPRKRLRPRPNCIRPSRLERAPSPRPPLHF